MENQQTIDFLRVRDDYLKNHFDRYLTVEWIRPPEWVTFLVGMGSLIALSYLYYKIMKSK